MENYSESTYGDAIADIYDEYYSEYDPASIDLLVELAQGGSALELGIGTGRIALPLQDMGVNVSGIDSSEAMLARLSAKPRGMDIKVAVGSFADFTLDEKFQLIYVVFNTFFNLQNQAEQVQCMKAVQRHLHDGGKFLIEAFVPNPCRFTDHQAVRVIDMNDAKVRLEVSKYDPVEQKVSTQHMIITDNGIRFQPVKIRFAWPSELDLMAQIAGLALESRWSSWSKDEFDQQSQKHISVYKRAGKAR